MTNVNEFIQLTLTAKINELKERRASLVNDSKSHVESIECNGERVSEARNQIEDLRRFEQDCVDNIVFYNDMIFRNSSEIEEIDSLIKPMEELTASPAPAKPKAKRKVRTQVGELTPEQSEKIAKKYAPLLALRGVGLYEYMQYLRAVGYPEKDTAISESLGKPSNWLGSVVQSAKNAGYVIKGKY